MDSSRPYRPAYGATDLNRYLNRVMDAKAAKNAVVARIAAAQAAGSAGSDLEPKAVHRPNCDHGSDQTPGAPCAASAVHTLGVPSNALQDKDFVSAHHLGVKGFQLESRFPRRVRVETQIPITVLSGMPSTNSAVSAVCHPQMPSSRGNRTSPS